MSADQSKSSDVEINKNSSVESEKPEFQETGSETVADKAPASPPSSTKASALTSEWSVNPFDLMADEKSVDDFLREFSPNKYQDALEQGMESCWDDPPPPRSIFPTPPNRYYGITTTFDENWNWARISGNSKATMSTFEILEIYKKRNDDWLFKVPKPIKKKKPKKPDYSCFYVKDGSYYKMPYAFSGIVPKYQRIFTPDNALYF